MMVDWICKKCGNCCKNFTKPVKNPKEVLKAHKEETGFNLIEPEIKITLKGTCEFFNPKTHECKIYKDRPDLCKNYFCKKHTGVKVLDGQIYAKLCLVCKNIRRFQKGTERDRQSVCGNCWVW